MPEDFKLLGNRIMILPEEAENKKGSIVIPFTLPAKPLRGTAIAVGLGRHHSSGRHAPVGVDEGDTIIYTKGDYQKYKYHEKEHIIINAANVIARTNDGIRSEGWKEHIARLFEGTAFYDTERGNLEFYWQATRDIVFVVPDPLPEKYKVPGEEREPLLFIPDQFREKHGNEYGIVISVGPGYYDRYMKFKPTGVEVGDRVAYDTGVPWALDFTGVDGKDHIVKYMGFGDCKAIVPRD